MLPKLVDLLNLQQLSPSLFRGQSWDLGFPAVFGGQVLGQALMAAYRTVSETQIAHSFHSYFLLPGNAKLPIDYDVEVVRDGRSFAMRRVKAMQGDNILFYMTVSFQYPEENITHTFPAVASQTDPESLQSDVDMYQAKFAQHNPHIEKVLAYHRPIDIRTENPTQALGKDIIEPRRQCWFKAQETLGTDIALQHAALAYASDYHFLGTALQAHPLSFGNEGLRMATIDHAMWFHQNYDFSQWHNFSIESPFSGGGRAYVRGQIFDQHGQLVASASQEGLLRYKAQN